MDVLFIYFVLKVVLNGYLYYNLAITNSFSIVVFGQVLDSYKSASLASNIYLKFKQ